MRVAFLSDIHGNLEALEAVLSDVATVGVDTVICLGDVVGYGPDPLACIAHVLRITDVWVQGNHDLAALPEERFFRALFRPDAQAALDWTEGVLDSKARAVLGSLPSLARGPWGLAAHANPDDLLDYVQDVEEAGAALRRAAAHGFPQTAAFAGRDLLWLGHTHIPLAVHEAGEGRDRRLVRVALAVDDPVRLEAGRWLLNPGSVGQPRDGDSRARWAVLDAADHTVVLRAVSYDYRLTQAKMEEAGLPPGIIDMLGL